MRSILRSLPAAFRRRGLRIAATLVLRAVLNLAGLAALLPVLTLVLDPAGFEGDGPLATVYVWSGVASPRTFALAVCGAVVGFIVLKCGVNFLLARAERRYIYDLYRTLSRRLYVTYHDRGLPFVKSSNSAVLARNVNVVCLAFTAGVLKPAAAIAAEALLLALKPFLRKERQEKIDRALHAARLASLASLALKNRGRGPGAKETP